MSDRPLKAAQGGFTLVEVMVVVLVIGILIGIGLPMFLGARVRAEERRTQAELQTGLTAGLTYWTEGGTFTGLDLNCSAVPDECTIADMEESSVAWVGPGAPSGSQVSIVFAAGNNVLLVARSTTGDYFCVAQETGHSDRGRGSTFEDVDSLVKCAGGWAAP